MDTEKIISFIKNNARPLDLAKYMYLYENGSIESFLEELKKYQNLDGGFGHGIEPDFLNPNSSPIATWYATEYIREIYPPKTRNNVILNTLKYLESKHAFVNGMWLNVIPSNDKYPHAVWWTYKVDNPSLNPTASLVAFIIDYADESESIYTKALKIIKTCFVEYRKQPLDKCDMHTTACMIQMYETLSRNNINHLFNLVVLKEKILGEVMKQITEGLSKWNTDYVAMPSNFVKTKESFLYPYLRRYLQNELSFASNNMLEDGSFKISWQWWTNYQKEEEKALHYWKSIICLKKLSLIDLNCDSEGKLPSFQ